MESISDNNHDSDPPKRQLPRRKRWRVTIERDLPYARIPRALIERACMAVGRGENARGEIRVIVVGDARMQQLNRRFCKRDRPTDVLAFPDDRSFPTPINMEFLGEVYCNFDHARRWRREHGGTQSAELARLAVHGCLHLLGYNHGTRAEQQTMITREDRYLAGAGLMAPRSLHRNRSC